MAKIRIGIIGLGSWGECHLQACGSLVDAEVVAICDVQEERTNALADRWGIPHRYTDSRELLSRDDIDLVSIVVREEEHLRIALQAVRSGKHVLVEKPIFSSHEKARQMMDEANRNGRIAAAGHVLRFEPRYSAIRQAITDGSLGKPYSMYFRRSRTREMLQMNKRIHTVFESMVHDIDLAIWYAGARVKNVRAFERKVHHEHIPDILWANLEFENGVLAVLQSNWMTPGAAGIILNDAVEVLGEHGTTFFDNHADGVQFWNQEGRFTPDVTVHRVFDHTASGALLDQYTYLCRCIREGKELECISFADAVHGIQVAEAIIESAETGRDIQLG